MSYIDAYKFPFKRAGWLKNLLMMALCTMIPLVGPMALWGYLRVVFLDLYENPGAECAEFTFDRFGQYIGWGVWPFLAGLLLGMAVLPVMMAGQIGLIFLPGMGLTKMAMLVFLVIWVMVYIGAIVLVNVINLPVMLRAMLMQDFSAAFNLRFMKDFLGKMWVDLLIKQMFIMVTSIPIMLVGLLCCGVGMLPAAMIIMMAGWYLQIQIYRDYLARGGVEIPIKPLEGPASIRAFEVQPGPDSGQI